jgi:putative ABC transport system permease protein
MLLKTSLRSFLAHKGRMVLSLTAIVLSVAFVSGTLVFSNTATKTFDRLFASTTSDLSVRHEEPKHKPNQQGSVAAKPTAAKPTTVPVDTVETLSGLPGVKIALGRISVQNATLVDPATNKAIGPSSGAPTLTGNWTGGPRSALDITSGHAPQGDRQIVLDADTAKKAKLGLGSPMRVITATGSYDFTISGIATFRTTNPGAALAFMDTATAQHDLLDSTAYTSVEVYGDGSETNEQLKSQALSVLGSGYTVKTGEEQKAENAKGVGSFLGFMKYAMLGFALVSLLVGSFLIVNTFSMLVAQRTREIGLLRALGGSRPQVNLSVLTEALFLGVLGSTLGLGGGVGLASILIQLMKAVGMNLDASSLDIAPVVPIAAYSVGVLITLLAAAIPARRASKIAPLAALRDHGTPDEGQAGRGRTVLGLLITGLGAAALVAAATDGKAGTGGAFLGFGVLLTLVGFVVLGPLLASGIIRVLGALLPLLRGPAGRLAQRNALRNPRRTGATAAALMIGLSLVTGASVVTSSMVSSASAQIDKSVGADYIVTANQSGITPAMVKAARSTPGLAHITEERTLPVTLTTSNGMTKETSLLAASPTFVDDFRMPVSEGRPEAVFDGGISVDQDFARANNLHLGDRLTLDYGQGRRQSLPLSAITVVGNSLFDKNFFTSIDTVSQVVPIAEQPTDSAIIGKATPGGDVDKTLAALQKSLEAYPQLSVKDQAGIKEVIQSQVNGLLSMVYGLLGLAIVVAVLGVVNTLALSVMERTREIGLLRAIGLSRRQLRRMIRLESVVISVFGALLATVLGLAWGVCAQRVLSTQGLDTLTIPTGAITRILVGSATIGVVAALIPALRAGRMNVLASIATD